MLPPVRLSVCPSVTRVLCDSICHASGRNFSDGSNNDSCSSSAAAVSTSTTNAATAAAASTFFSWCSRCTSAAALVLTLLSAKAV